ncbi:hydrolase [Bacillus sp. FJAT-27225]|uniref:C39 family peptidase n=1 Tax=Bacillus sp. FJAT-27225 TaxID=1743144 RepID=UPI00080C25CB|nr:C39 family peptidase [Bacillus sp. FJAT-27225]OCA87538.1 hydrolase [Bacillus sp. FJAT-27225]
MKKIWKYGGVFACTAIAVTAFALSFKDEAASAPPQTNTATLAETPIPDTSFQEAPTAERYLPSKDIPVWLPDSILMDVPLFNQMAAPRLYNGCEVTSLAMILTFKGIEVTKNELAKSIERVPLNYRNGKKGNPNAGFVGDMENGPGLGVYHEPIFDLAKKYAGDRAENLTGQSFDMVIEKLADGSPVWVIINTIYAPLGKGNFATWDTPDGPVDITFKMHSVAITGYDETHIYVNDPYGTKNLKVDRQNFIKAWEQLGSQAITIN